MNFIASYSLLETSITTTIIKQTRLRKQSVIPTYESRLFNIKFVWGIYYSNIILDNYKIIL